MEYAYHLKLVEPGGSGFRDVTGLAQSVTWSGDARQIARPPVWPSPGTAAWKRPTWRRGRP